MPLAHVQAIKSYLSRTDKGWLDPRVDQETYLQLVTRLAFLKDIYSRVQNKKKVNFENQIASTREAIKKLLKCDS